jgi:hypothetical protein
VSIREYEPEAWDSGLDENDGVHHRIRFRNDSDRVVVAAKFGVLCYNIFDEFQAGSEDIVVGDLLPGKRQNHFMRTFHDDPQSFHTGLIYVAKVRFMDGGIWEADLQEVDGQILAFEAELKAASTGGGG